MNTRLIDYILEATAAGLDISIREVGPVIEVRASKGESWSQVKCLESAYARHDPHQADLDIQQLLSEATDVNK